MTLTRRDLTLAAAVASVTLALFVFTLRPDVGGTEDSPKFQFVGQVLGTAHTPGYPFYVISTYVFSRVPIGTLAYRVNLFSAICGALACLCVFLTARRLGVTQLLSVAAALAAATSFPVWSNSITAEVYTLAAALSGFAVYFLIAFGQTAKHSRLYLACASWAAGFGNHLTISAILPAALVYGIYKHRRAVLRPTVAATAAIIGVLGVLQYGFIALRTIQGAPYLEARATTIQGVFDVIIARDVSWARFYQAQSAVAAIEVPMLLNGLRANMGLIPIALVAFAIVVGVKRRNPEVLLIFGAAAATLAMIANLWGDVVGFITPVCVQLWPLAALGLQWLVTIAPVGPGAVTIAGVLALLLPVQHYVSIRPRIEALRAPGEGPGVRALYAKLPARSAVVAENYWLARLVNYMHFSGEYSPDPNPRVLDNDAADVRKAVEDGLEVYAFEGATHWLNAQGFRFERTGVARQPFAAWLAAQPRGTLVAAATSGQPLPFDWLPPASRTITNRPANYGAVLITVGETEAAIEQNDAGVSASRVVGAEGRTLTVAANDDGPAIMWGDDVVGAIDRGMVAAAFNPAGQLIGQWSFAPDEAAGVQPPPTPFVLKGTRTCQILTPGRRTDVSDVLADGSWLATAEGHGNAVITLSGGPPASTWRHVVSNGRGEAGLDARGSQILLSTPPATRTVFRLSLPVPGTTSDSQAPSVPGTIRDSKSQVVPGTLHDAKSQVVPGTIRDAKSQVVPGTGIDATLEPGGVGAVRVCREDVPGLPASGALGVGPEHDGWFSTGWHLGERGGTQRFRWSEQRSTMTWRMDQPSAMRMLLHLRAAHAKGATFQAELNGVALPACALPAAAWTDCKIDIPATATRAGINRLTLTADTVSPSADRPGDARELAFVMQASRVRTGQ